MGFWAPLTPLFPAVVELCLSHGLGPVALANELLAFVTSKDLDLQLTPEGLDAFEHEVGVPDCPPAPQNPRGWRGALTPPLLLPQVLAKRSSRSRRGRDERRGLLHDIHSLQELYPEIPIARGVWGALAENGGL